MKKKIRKIIIVILINAVVIMILGEIVSRAFWSVNYDIPFFNTDKIIYVFYPNIRYIDNNYKNGNSMKILMLGASVLDPKMSTIQYHLEQDINNALNRNVDVYNAAIIGQTTIDSRVKFDYLKNKHFDYILLYHGINDLAANNAPDSLFDEDYSMFWWYYSLRTFQQHKEKKYISLFYTLHFAWNSMLYNAGILDLSTIDRPKKEWMYLGRINKSLPVLRNNMEYIVSESEKKGVKVIMSTFINYVPDNYTEREFDLKRLDYADHTCPNSEWGLTLNVKRGLVENNEVITEIAHKHKNVLFDDLNSRFVKNKSTFNDICHLTDWGAGIFSSYVTTMIMDDIGMKGVKNNENKE